MKVYILTYNRPQLVMRSVRSVLDQVYGDFELVVSDNSTNGETEALFVGISDPRLTYRRRIPSLPGIDHFRLVMSEVDSDFFVMFHDDDEMLPGFLVDEVKKFDEDDGLVAVGSNAIVSVNGRKKSLKVKSLKADLTFDKKEDFLRNYLVGFEVCPFPSYMYKKSVSEKIIPKSGSFGKYWDVAFLMDVLSAGKIAWIVKPEMIYHVHPAQDSVTFDFINRQMLIKHICSETYFAKSSKEIINYRVASIYGQLLLNLREGKRFRIAHKRREYLSVFRWLGLSPLVKLFLYPPFLFFRKHVGPFG